MVAMKNLSQILLLFFIIIVPAGANAQTGGPVAPAERERVGALWAQRSEALFNLDYERARQLSTQICREFAAHPACPLSLASLLWIEEMNESRRLQSSLYSSKSFYSKTEDKVKPKLIEDFRAYILQAKRLAGVRLKQNKEDTEALYYLGTAEGLNAAFSATIQRSFMSALRDGSRSVGHHRQVLRLDPNYLEAELTVGLYEYAVSCLPLPVKLLVSLGGVRGSKKRGIETLERVARLSPRAGDDARVLLITIFKREKRYAEALKYARELSGNYERNYLFKMEVADALMLRAASDRKARMETEAVSAEREALAIYDGLIRDRKSAGSSTPFDLIHFRYGEALLAARQPERASLEFRAAIREPRAEEGIASMAYLRNAQALDMAGKRKEALEEYRSVLKRPDTYNTHEDAKKGLREPFGGMTVN
jgi:tetratricopeptide (TPR) repeat protein